jgi:AcrR family transcriptional regulator
VSRTVDATAHAVRRDAFVDVAERLIRTKGYEQMSVQDVLEELGTSKGAFYHYFDSKADLLTAVIDRMTDAVIGAMRPIADDPDMPALDKLRGVFATAGRWKADRRDLTIAVQRAWYADDNALVRERFARVVGERLPPLFAGIIHQGKAEGTFTVTSPDHAAAILVALMVGADDTTGRLFLARIDGLVPYDDVATAVAAFDEAFERILGLSPGSFELVDEPTLRRRFA